MSKIKVNIPMLTALLLLLLTMVSSHFTSGLYARYTTQAQSSATARVAKFDVRSAVTENDDGSYTLTVTNNSEVAVRYSVTVTMDEKLRVTVDGVEGALSQGAASVVLRNDSWRLAPAAQAQLAMTFDVTDWSGLTDPNELSGETEQVAFSFAVQVTAEQLD